MKKKTPGSILSSMVNDKQRRVEGKTYTDILLRLFDMCENRFVDPDIYLFGHTRLKISMNLS